jgi:hypothetical protein
LDKVALEDLNLDEVREGQFHCWKRELEEGKYDWIPHPVIVYLPERKEFDVVSKYDARRFQVSGIGHAVCLKEDLKEHKGAFADLVKECLTEVREELTEKKKLDEATINRAFWENLTLTPILGMFISLNLYPKLSEIMRLPDSQMLDSLTNNLKNVSKAQMVVRKNKKDLIGAIKTIRMKADIKKLITKILEDSDEPSSAEFKDVQTEKRQFLLKLYRKLQDSLTKEQLKLFTDIYFIAFRGRIPKEYEDLEESEK